MGVNQRQIFCLVLVISLLTGCSAGSTIKSTPKYWPMEGWLIGEPSDLGIDPSRLQSAVKCYP